MPVYLFWGDEDFNIELKIKELKKNVLKNDINPLNYRKINNPSFSQTDEILRSQGMMFGNILFVISANKYFLNEGKSAFLNDKETEELIKSFENVADNVHVVFVCQIPPEANKKPDSRKKLYKALAKYGKIEAFERFKAWEDYKAIPWVKNQAKKAGIQMEAKAAERLVQTTGMSLRDLNNNLEKLALLAHPSKTITEKMIDEVCTESKDIFAVSNLLIKGEFTKALNEISKLLEKQSFLVVLAFLQSACTKFLQIKLYSDDCSPIEIAKIVGQHEFVVKQNLQKVQNVNLKELVRLKQNLTEIEYKLKTGDVSDPLLAFELAFNKGGAN